MSRLFASAALSAVVAVLATGAAHAQESSASQEAGNEFSDIVVTARKRAESIQDVPVSVTALSAALIERNNITRIDQVTQYTPNVILVPISISPTQAAPFIRAIGNYQQEPSLDPAVALSVDGVYTAQIAGSLLDVFDAEQIEVLRGPQGTLQGRNSPGGAVNVTTRRPSGDFGGRFEASYGNYDHKEFKGVIEAPIAQDKVAAKLAAFYLKNDGYVQNIITGNRMNTRDTFAMRGGILFTPNEDLNIYVTADYTRDRSSQVAFVYTGTRDGPNVLCTVFTICQPNAKRTSRQNYDRPGNKLNAWGITANADWTFGDVTLTSITGYRKQHDIQNADIDATEVEYFSNVNRHLDTKQFSQEFRLSSSKAGRPTGGELVWVVGAYYLHSTFDLVQAQRRQVLVGGAPTTPPTFANPVGIRDQTLKAYALFGQASYYLTDQWSISVGARQSWDDKVLTAKPANETTVRAFKADFDNLSLEAGTEYKINPDVLAYFRFAQAYRAGGINGAPPAFINITAYDPEKIDSYEGGLKTEWFDRRLTFNVTGFYYKYKNQQRGNVITIGGIVANILANGGASKAHGLEVEMHARPTDNLRLSASYGYLKGKYLDPAFRARKLQQAPRNTFNFSADYDIPLGDSGTVTLSGDVGYRSDYNVTIQTTRIGAQEGFALVNGSINYRTADDRYGISLYGRNLFNKYYITDSSTIAGLSQYVFEGPPRTYGVRVSAKF